MYKSTLIAAAVFGFLAVALGAFGAHGLKDVLDAYGHRIYEKAVLYQMFHTIALLGVGILQYNFKEINLSPSAVAFSTGIILFSGSLYILVISGVKWFGIVTPFGGLSFLFGWLWLAFKLFKAGRKQ